MRYDCSPDAKTPIIPLCPPISGVVDFTENFFGASRQNLIHVNAAPRVAGKNNLPQVWPDTVVWANKIYLNEILLA